DHKGPLPAPGGLGPGPTRPARTRTRPAPGGLPGEAPRLVGVGPARGVAPPPPALPVTSPPRNKTSTTRIAPGRVAGFHRPVDTALAPARRRVPLPEPHCP